MLNSTLQDYHNNLLRDEILLSSIIVVSTCFFTYIIYKNLIHCFIKSKTKDDSFDIRYDN